MSSHTDPIRSWPFGETNPPPIALSTSASLVALLSGRGGRAPQPYRAACLFGLAYRLNFVHLLSADAPFEFSCRSTRSCESERDVSKPKDSSDICARVGKRLKMIRLARGLKQHEVAAALGVSFQQVQKYESATVPISVERLLRASEFFGVTLNFLLLADDTDDDLRQPTNRLQALRLQTGLSLRDLGEAAGTSHQNVRKLETGAGQLTVGWLIRFAVVLGCHPWAIIDPLGGDDVAEEALLQQIRSLNREQRVRVRDAAAD